MDRQERLLRTTNRSTENKGQSIRNEEILFLANGGGEIIGEDICKAGLSNTGSISSELLVDAPAAAQTGICVQRLLIR